MKTIRGIAVFSGVAIGPALVLDQQGTPIAQHLLASDSVPTEVDRLDRCLAAVARELDEHAALVCERLGKEVAAIFSAHANMVRDNHLRDQILAHIRNDQWTAEFSARKVLRKYAELFQGLGSSPFADRATDILDIERRIVDRLVGERGGPLENLPHEVIVIAQDLTPSETASLDSRFVKGLATEAGGRTSHTAIIAGAMEIPAVVGTGKLMDVVKDGDLVIIDGNSGVLIVNPDEETQQRYQSTARDFLRFVESLNELRDLPAETIDGHRIQLMANIEFPQDAEHCLERGADGVGLYRTEFLYLDRETAPTEEEHYETYASVLKVMGADRPVVFRTMDLGADKLNGNFQHPHENNPFLGLRSIRLSLKHVGVFKTQLRALLRASVLGNMRIMFPLVSTLLELRRCRMLLADVMEDLEEEGVAFRRDIPIGVMMEVPSAALLADQFAQNVDFFSIGTNDLIQYTLACDRTNETVAPLYSASDPAVLKLVRLIVRAAQRHNIEVNVCGEMSGDPIYTLLLLGMGLRQLSVAPHGIPEIKKIIRGVTLADAEKATARVFRLDTAGAITNYLRNRTRRIVPELIDDLS